MDFLPDSSVLILSAIIIMVTHFVGSIAAYGSTLLALPFMIWLVGDVETSVVTLLIVGTISSYQIAAYTYRDTDWRKLSQMMIWLGIGLPIGFLSMKYLPQKHLLLALGIVLLANGIPRIWKGSTNVVPPPGFALKSLIFFGGVIHGAFACGGATIAVYAQHALTEKAKMRGTLAMVWVIIDTVMIVNVAAQRMITMPVIWLSAIALPFLLLGTWMGDITARRISQQLFTRIVASLLVIAGVITVSRIV